MGYDSTSIRRTFGQDEQPGGCRWGPAELLPGDPTPKAMLLAESPEGLLDRGQFRLDLDHQQRARRRMECEDIDRPSLTVDRVGHLDFGSPAISHKDCDHRSNEAGVTFVEGPVQGAATPAHIEVDPAIKCREDSADRPHGHRVQVPSFGDRNARLRNAASIRQVGLAPAAATAQGPDRQSNSPIVHAGIVAGSPYPARIAAVTRPCSTDRRRMRDTVQRSAPAAAAERRGAEGRH